MLSNIKNLVTLTGQLIKKCEFQNSFLKEKLSVVSRCDFYIKNQAQNFHTSTPRNRISHETQYKNTARRLARKEGKVDETFGGDLSIKRKEGYFPTVDLPNTMFGSTLFKDLPVVRIKATKNNTKLCLVDKGVAKLLRTCGTEGFKNTRKGTNIAAQTVGVALGQRAVKQGYKTVRVLIQGLGSGRLSAIKGLQLGGMDVVSITDNTVDYSHQRPRKQRRL